MNTPHPVESLLGQDPAEQDRSWERVQSWARRRFGREPSIESLLFLIGVQASGGDFDRRLTKEAKQDLIMEGTCRAFESIGLFERRGGTWRRTVAFPALDEAGQERLLRLGIASYLGDLAAAPQTESNQ